MWNDKVEYLSDRKWTVYIREELQFAEGKKPYPREHRDDLYPFKILENQEGQMSQELFWGWGEGRNALPYSRDQKRNH